LNNKLCLSKEVEKKAGLLKRSYRLDERFGRLSLPSPPFVVLEGHFNQEHTTAFFIPFMYRHLSQQQLFSKGMVNHEPCLPRDCCLHPCL
jgi:hypothetical protein